MANNGFYCVLGLTISVAFLLSSIPTTSSGIAPLASVNWVPIQQCQLDDRATTGILYSAFEFGCTVDCQCIHGAPRGVCNYTTHKCKCEYDGMTDPMTQADNSRCPYCTKEAASLQLATILTQAQLQVPKVLAGLNATQILVPTTTSPATNCATTPSSDPPSGSRTCKAKFPFPLGQGGFKVCTFGANNNLITVPVETLGNAVWSLQAAMYAGKCYCNQDCNPSQIVCEDPIDLGFGNVSNGVARITYNAAAYQIYCYCPEYVPAGQNPCSTPINPTQCTPVG